MIRTPIQHRGHLGIDGPFTGAAFPVGNFQAPLGADFQAIPEFANNASVDLAALVPAAKIRIGPKGMAVYSVDLDAAGMQRADRVVKADEWWNLLSVWNAKDLGVSMIGPTIQTSVAGLQPDASGNMVPWPVNHPGKGVMVQPAYSELFNADPTGQVTKTLTAQKYCVQCFGTGAEVVCGAFGTATAATPLQFTGTAADCLFTPTNCEHWMLTAAGGHVFPRVGKGISVTSTASTSGGNGLAIPLNAAMTAALSGGAFTAAALCWMGVGSGELPTAFYGNVLTSRDSLHDLKFSNVSGTPQIGNSDGANTSVINATWDRGSMLLSIVQINSAKTQKRPGCRRYTPAMVAIDANIVWGSWAAYDGSMNPLTHLRFGYNLTVPIGFLQTQLWGKSASEAEILKVAGYAV